MKIQTWLEKNTASLAGRTVVITGATGGLGAAACRDVLALGGRLLLVNRSPEKTAALRRALLTEFPQGSVDSLRADLTDIEDVKAVTAQLKQKPIDILLLNAGAYSIPRKTCTTGWDNVFQTNFVSHYYMVRELLPLLSRRKGRIVAVGSIAHWYSKTDPADIDFAHRSAASLVYGNSKRYLMYALTELLQKYPEVRFAIAHPGISFTNITAHYPKLIFAVIKWPMKVIFMRPDKAVLSIIQGMFDNVPPLHWIGPGFFHIWGLPRVRALNSADAAERARIFHTAEDIYQKLISESPSESTPANGPAARP